MVASIRRGDRPVSTPVHLPDPVLGRVTSVAPASVPPPATSRNYHTWVCSPIAIATTSSPITIATTSSHITIATTSSTITIATTNINPLYIQYLGSGLVKGPPGKHSAEEACLRLKVSPTQCKGHHTMPCPSDQD